MKLDSLIIRNISNLFYNFLNLFAPNYTHIYIDESICEKAGLATLTAILIPQRKLKRVTSDFYKIVRQIIDKYPERDEKNKSKIIYPAPLLHGNSLLKNSKEDKDNYGFDFSIIDDDFRIKVFNDIIDIVHNHRLRIVRLGYNNYNEFRKRKFKDDKMYSLNWLGLSRYIDNFYKIRNAICIMDGNDSNMIHAISQFILGSKSHSFLYPETRKSLIIHKSKRFIGNVFYVPAKYSECLQIIDIISYILHKKDYIDITGKKSDFSTRIYDLHSRLENNRVVNSVIKLQMQ
jgi:hypothetical protein